MPAFLRAVMALSTAVTALRAVVLTPHLTLADTTVRVDQLRTFDSTELSYRVFHLVNEQYPNTGISSPTSTPGVPMNECPTGVAIKNGVTFTCAFDAGGREVAVRVLVEDAYSGELEVDAPTPRPRPPASHRGEVPGSRWDAGPNAELWDRSTRTTNQTPVPLPGTGA